VANQLNKLFIRDVTIFEKKVYKFCTPNILNTILRCSVTAALL